MAEQAVSLPTHDDVHNTLSNCATFSLRKASRLTTQMFDEALAPCGLRSTQLIILATLFLNENIRLSELARQLVLSPSTLSRNLKPLMRDGLVETDLDQARQRKVSLTNDGAELLRKSLPHWKAAQMKFVLSIGAPIWKDLSPLLRHSIENIQIENNDTGAA
ncbi:MAG: winged helix-turn-helix transcriptional regulator [Bdellovibrionales bacterium]|nr:winged helix-turn-helix transcriptional regulator [Bdellovibrionales bacterium]